MKIKIPNLFLNIGKYSFTTENNNIFIGRSISKKALEKRLKPDEYVIKKIWGSVKISKIVDSLHFWGINIEILFNKKREVFFFKYLKIQKIFYTKGESKSCKENVTLDRIREKKLNSEKKKEKRTKEKEEEKEKYLKFRKESYRGAYLVAGYRGMGKSTLVDEVIRKINGPNFEEKKLIERDIINIKVNLSQESISDNEFLRQLFIELESKLISIKKIRPNLIVPLSTLIILILVFKFNSIFKDFFEKLGINIKDFFSFDSPNFFTALKVSVVITSITICIIRILRWFIYQKTRRKLFDRIKEVKRRIYSRLEVNQSDFISNSLSIVGKGNHLNTSSVPSFLGQNVDSTPYKQAFEKISTKELEFEVKEILKLYDLYRKRNNITTGNIVFVIDELDKIEPEFILEDQATKAYTKSTTENRKETISKLLSNLKSFIHTASAKFVFIGGAEMYEASLADIADRESFYSSIFHEVIYVPTFFKDFNLKADSLTQMTEEYFYNVVCGKKDKDQTRSDNKIQKDNSNHYFLKKLFDETVGGLKNDILPKEHKEFILYQYYRFIIYLTYRSNGSPKKLKEFLEYYMIPKENQSDVIGDKGITIQSNISKKAIKDSYYIKLKTTQQHKLGILSSIFMPYMLKNETHKKKYNDKLLYLSAFLLDHILKFHKSAFSWRELELMPDIIIGSKTPNLRETLKELIDYLSIRHIRETTNAMFQYKFRSGTTLELKYISKISDESAAAFNFTFDESHHLKAYYKRQLKQYIELYQNNVGLSLGQSSTVHSISLINSTIADLNFYDEDYDEAIKFYSDAVQTMRDAKTHEEYELTKHQQVLFTRNRLLLSLSLEKSSKYDSAYSIIRSITLDQQKSQKSNQYLLFDTKKWEDPYKRMQMFLRPHLALLAVIEKDRSDGITFSNLQRNIQEYTKTIGCISLFPTQEFKENIKYNEILEYPLIGDSQRVHTLLADYYQSVGSILFFKNNFFTTLFNWGTDGIFRNFMRIKYKGKRLCSNSLKEYLFTKSFDKKIDGQPRKHFYPSISSLFYYLISLEHLIIPYQENLSYDGIFDGKMMFDIIEDLTEDTHSYHLTGKHKFFIGLILSKMSDALLCNLSDFSLKIFVTKNNFDRWQRNFWLLELEVFDEFFSIENVLYLNILSYKYFRLSGNDYDAFFSLKKCMHIIRTHFFLKNERVHINQGKFQLIKEITMWLKVECDTLLSSNEYFSPSKEGEIYQSVYPKFSLNTPLIWSTDKEELELINCSINIKLKRVNVNVDVKQLDIFKKQIPTLKSIFTRLQYLRYSANLFFYEFEDLDTKNIDVELSNKKQFKCKKLIDFIKNIENIQYCYTSLINIYNTQGQSYIMNYSYLAVAYNNLKTWSNKIKDLKSNIENQLTKKTSKDEKKLLENSLESLSIWKFNDIEYLKRNVIYYYEKIIQLHSEGKEYKNFIKELYMLEDDFNDSLVHFCAALERSLINSGEVERKINDCRK